MYMRVKRGLSVVLPALVLGAAGRWLYVREDGIVNKSDCSFLANLSVRHLFPFSEGPWISSDKKLRDKFSRLAGINISNLGDQVTKEVTHPVFLSTKKKEESSDSSVSVPHYDAVTVGGFPVLNIAYTLSTASHGTRVLHCDSSSVVPISTWSAFHMEPDGTTTRPGYTNGKHVMGFCATVLKEIVWPSRYSKEVIDSAFPFLALNLWESALCLKQWPEMFSVAAMYAFHSRYSVSNSQKMMEHAQLARKGHERLRDCSPDLYGPSSSYVFAFNTGQSDGLVKTRRSLELEGLQVPGLTIKEIEDRTGIHVYGLLSAFEKKHDIVLKPSAMEIMKERITVLGGEVKSWHLKKVSIGPKKIMLTFTSQDNPDIRITADKVYLSLGRTRFSPQVMPLISVTGVSINAIVELPSTFDTTKHTIRPMVFGNSNHMVPISLPVKNPETGRYEIACRLTGGASVGPRDRLNPYSFNQKHAVHLLSQVRGALGGERVEVVSVFGGDRLIGGSDMPEWVDVNKDGRVMVHSGAGGKGLSMGPFFVASRLTEVASSEPKSSISP